MAFESNNFTVVKKEKFSRGEFLVEGGVALSSPSKILSVCADAYVSSVEVLAGQVNFSGVVTMQVIYLTGEGETEKAEENVTFSSKFESDNITAGQKAIVKVKVIDCEVSAFSGDSVRLSINLEQSGEIICEKEISSIRANDDDICFKDEQISVIKFVGEASEVASLSSQVTARGKVKKVLMTESSVLVKNVEAGVNFVSVSGDIVSRVLYVTEEDKFESAYVTDAFKQEVELSGTSQDSLVEGYATVRKDNVSVQVEEDDKGGKVNLTIPVEFAVKAYEQVSVNVIRDLYSVTNDIKVTTESFDMTHTCKAEIVEGKIDGSLTIEDDKPRIDKLLFVGGNSLCVSNSYLKDGEVVIEGIAKTNVVYLNDEENSLTSVQIEVPFVISDKFSQENVEGLLMVDAILCDVDVVAKKGRELLFDAKVKACVNYCYDEVSGVISEALVLDAYPEKEYAMELVYAQKGQDAWDIAKSAKVKEGQIVAQNPDVVFPLMEDTGLILFYQKI